MPLNEVFFLIPELSIHCLASAFGCRNLYETQHADQRASCTAQCNRHYSRTRLFGSTPYPIPCALAKIFSETDEIELQKDVVLDGGNLALSTARSQNQRLPHTLEGYAAQQSPDNHIQQKSHKRLYLCNTYYSVST